MNRTLLGDSWFPRLEQEINQPYFDILTEELRKEYHTHRIYPKPDQIFRALQLTPFEEVRVVIVGQDPYPFGEHADGLAFSSKLKDTPASLQTILREVDRDVVKTKNSQEFKEAFPTNDLSNWAKQGVLLLNSCLTVRAGEVNSHKHLGWDRFVKEILRQLYEDQRRKVFLLWGNEAQSLMTDILHQGSIHKILACGHPATAGKGKDLFSGCNHFSKTNYYFWRKGLTEINWKLNNGYTT